MQSLLSLFDTLINLYIWALIISVVLTTLVSRNVINTSNRFVYMAGDFLHRITEPALGRIRRFVPNLFGIDIAPRVLFLGLVLVRNLVF